MRRKMKLVEISSVLGVTLLMVFTCFVASAQDYIIPSQGSVNASISDTGVNHIAVSNDRIIEVIGNEDEYIIESDANLGQIYLTPILKSPQNISLRLITEREKIIDVKFKIKKIEPQTLNLKYKNDSNISSIGSNSSANPNFINNNFINNQMGSNTVSQEVIDNLKLAYSNKLHGSKLPVLGCLKINSKLKTLKLIEATQYSVNKQVIVKAVVSNPKSDPILLNEIDFSNCMKIVKAVSLDNNRLAQGMSTTIYMVGQDGK